jgi:hypothetical protein
MAKINIPRVVRPVDLGAYSPEMRTALEEAKASGGSSKPLYMWVNPTLGRLQTFGALMARYDECVRMQAGNAKYVERKRKENEGLPPAQQIDVLAGLPYPTDLIQTSADDIARQLNVWWADIWSHGPEGTHWTPEEIEELHAQCRENDPGFWEWIHAECWRMVHDYRDRAKKA